MTNRTDICELCGWFPTIGICPNCHRVFCPDHVQLAQPFMLCSQCEQNFPNYFTTNGRWLGNDNWLDYNSGLEFQSNYTRFNRSIQSYKDFWKILEELNRQQGTDLWKELSYIHNQAGNRAIAKLCSYRISGLYDPEEILQHAIKLGESMEYERALGVVEDLLVIIPGHERSIYFRGWFHYEQKNFQQALEDFNRLIVQSPGNPDPYIMRAQVYLSGYKDYDRAMQDIDTIERMGKMNAYTYYMRGFVHSMQVILYGRYQQADLALSNLNRALQMDSNYYNAYQLKGFINLLQCNDELAAKDFEKILPQFQENYSDLGFLFL